MQITNLTLAYIVLELRESLKGAHIIKAQECGENIFKFRLHTAQGTKDLIFSNIAPYLTQYKIPAIEKPRGFAEFLKSKISNKKITDIRQHNLDRVVAIELDEFNLIFEHFSEGNIILTDKNMKILMPLKKQEWKDRKIARNETYVFPKGKTSPEEITEGRLAEIFSSGRYDAIGALMASMNIAPQFAEEALLLSKIDKKKQAAELSEKEIKSIVKEVKKIYSEISLGKLKPVVANSGLLLPCSLKSIPAENQIPVNSLNSALDDAISVNFLGTEKRAQESKKSKEIDKIKYSLGEQKTAEKKFEKQEAESKKRAGAIYAYYQELADLRNSLKKAAENKVPTEEIMYKVNSALNAKAGNKLKLTKIDIKKMKAIFDAEE